MPSLNDVPTINALTNELDVVNRALTMIQSGGQIVEIVVGLPSPGAGVNTLRVHMAPVSGVDTTADYSSFVQLLTAYQTDLTSKLAAMGITPT